MTEYLKRGQRFGSVTCIPLVCHLSGTPSTQDLDSKVKKNKLKLEIELAPYWRRNNTCRYIIKKRQTEDEKEVNKDSHRIIKEYDNNKDNIFIHTAEKCAFYKSLEQKQKPKKATFWKYRIQRYRNMHNSKVFCI